jgi:hypothetical protein
MTEQEVWQLILDEEPRMKRLCMKYARRDPRTGGQREQIAARADELYSDVVLARAHSIMATYDPSKGAAPATHLYANVNWYLYKEEARTGKQRYATPSLDESIDAPERVDRPAMDDAAIDAERLLDRVDDPDDERRLHSRVLWWTEAGGYTRQEIADHLELSASRVSAIYAEALRRARERKRRR